MRKYDVIIVGTGIAGLFTALNIKKKLKILLITKSNLKGGNSSLAQGGIVSCINQDTHFRDTISAGCFYNDSDAVRVIEKQSEKCINKLIDFGVKFERDSRGNFKYTREGGHSEKTILYSKDATGLEIIRCLIDEVKQRENIELLENTLVVDLFKSFDKIKGIKVLDEEDRLKTYHCSRLVLATGGVGRVYKNTTNSSELTGDGIALAYNVGAEICDMEFIQFHPTAVYGDDYERRFLISEAVRGEGGILRDISGRCFMENYHVMKDLAPRDIVSRSIAKEIKHSGAEFVYLDVTEKDSSYIKKRFPTIYEKCLKGGIDITKDFIRVSPAQHYIMGGIKTDLNGKTNIGGLFACGECACTGVHGANRLASNSLLEGIVFGEKISEIINCEKESLKECESYYKQTTSDEYQSTRNNQSLREIEMMLRDTMTENVSIIRIKKDLLYALDIIEKLEDKLLEETHRGKKFFEIKNMLTVSKLITKAAINREESIGSHFIVKED